MQRCTVARHDEAMANDGSVIKQGERPDGVGQLTWEDMEIKWAVYKQRSIQRTTDRFPIDVIPVRIIVGFGEHEALGEHFVDPIAFHRLSNETWPARVVEMAKATVLSAKNAQGMH